MHNSSLANAQYFWRIRTSVLYGNQKKFNIEAVNDYPPIRFEIRLERKFPIVGLYFLSLPVETLWNLCPVEKLFGMRMAGLCQFYWRTCPVYCLSFDELWLGSASNSQLSAQPPLSDDIPGRSFYPSPRKSILTLKIHVIELPDEVVCRP